MYTLNIETTLKQTKRGEEMKELIKELNYLSTKIESEFAVNQSSKELDLLRERYQEVSNELLDLGYWKNQK